MLDVARRALLDACVERGRLASKQPLGVRMARRAVGNCHADGGFVARSASAAQECVLYFTSGQAATALLPTPSDWQQLDTCLQMGLRDFVRQSGATGVIVGLSGGIDSTCVAALAVKALGAENVLGLSLPTALTSDLSRSLAKDFAAKLGIEFREISLQSIIHETEKALAQNSGWKISQGLPFENLQSRTRGLVLMAESNQSGKLLLACGNKSEYATGYGTLYGDTAGAMAPIGDLLKSEVYGLCHYWNSLQKSALIPQAILDRVPTAELAPNQKDTDSLPRYDVLDAFLQEMLDRQGLAFVTKDWSAFLTPHSKDALLNKIMGAEFKRYQCPPVLRVHNRAFGRSWNMPIATKV